MEIKPTQAAPDQAMLDPGRTSLGQFDLILFLGFFGLA